MDDWKQITARRLSMCEVCSKEIEKGQPLVWSRAKSAVRCIGCQNISVEKKPVKKISKVVGEAGASAKRQYKTRSAKDSSKVEFLHPRLAKLLRVDNVDSQTTKNWAKGAVGEEKVGGFLRKFIKKNGGVLLNDRQVPGTKKNLDHILITENAVFVIDAKNWSGTISVKSVARNSEVKEILYLNSYNQTKTVEKMKDQVEVVKQALKVGGFKVEAIGYLIFYGVDWPKKGIPTQVDGVLIKGKNSSDVILGIKSKRKVDVAAVGTYLEKYFPPR